MGEVRIYFDTSVIVALFLHDAFSLRTDEFMRSAAAVPIVSDFGAAEVSSAVARRVRMGEISVDDSRTSLANFDRWRAEIAGAVEIRPSDIATADLLLRRLDMNLRTPDAIHLAVTVRFGLALATFDRGMVTAAQTLGLTLAPV